MTLIHLKPADDRSIDLSIPCCASIVVRNQVGRLPHVLDYHRQLGIKQFFIIDNRSTDGTLEFARAQPDCVVLIADMPFKDSNGGSRWTQEAIDCYGNGRWWLIIDADELFTYPQADVVNIDTLCAYLDHTGAEGMFTTMVDMYSREPIADARCNQGQPFLNVCPYFDSQYTMRPRFDVPFGKPAFPPFEPIGGPRLRLFYPEFLNKGRTTYLAAKLMRSLRDKAKRLGAPLSFECAVPPLLFKIPLVKTSASFKIANSHKTTPIRLADITGALLHFKFFSDFHKNAVDEAERGQHYDGASEYRRYLKVMQTKPDLTLFHKESVYYAGPATFVKHGIMQSSQAYDAYVKQGNAA